MELYIINDFAWSSEVMAERNLGWLCEIERKTYAAHPKLEPSLIKYFVCAAVFIE